MKPKKKTLRPSVRMGKGKKCGCVLISIDEVCVTDLNTKIKMAA